jgi:ABC-type Fe3+ transport system substrate-binding protein
MADINDELIAKIESIENDLIDLRASNKVITDELIQDFMGLMVEVKALRYQFFACLSAAYGEEKAKSFIEGAYEKALKEVEKRLEEEGGNDVN